jgi:hypothetical protein
MISLKLETFLAPWGLEWPILSFWRSLRGIKKYSPMTVYFKFVVVMCELYYIYLLMINLYI